MNSEGIHRKPVTLLFNPFVYIAGGKALGLGLAAILVASLLGSLSNTHFDGVLDTHMGAHAPLWFFLAEGLVDWLSLAVVLLAAGKLISRTAFRAVDVIGTQALARWPTLLVSLVTLPPGVQRFTNDLVQQFLKPGQGGHFNPADAVVFGIAVVVMIPALCWMIYLMYKAYSVSCNVKGAKGIGTFIAGLILAEAVSKFAIYGLFRLV